MDTLLSHSQHIVRRSFANETAKANIAEGKAISKRDLRLIRGCREL